MVWAHKVLSIASDINLAQKAMSGLINENRDDTIMGTKQDWNKLSANALEDKLPRHGIVVDSKDHQSESSAWSACIVCLKVSLNSISTYEWGIGFRKHIPKIYDIPFFSLL